MDQLQTRNYVSLGITLLGATKLAAEAFGINFITDDQINALANLASVILTIAGIAMTHLKVNGDESK